MGAVTLFLLPGLAGVLLWLWRPSLAASRTTALGVAGLCVLGALGVLLESAAGGPLRQGFGGWPAPFGIEFVVDRLGALFVVLQAVLLFVTLLALRGESHGEQTLRRAHPLLLLLTLGLFGAFMTGDLFNLFVMFELVLVCSYLLLQVPGTHRSGVAALPAVIVNLVASLLFLGGLGLLYAICGSLNLADLSQQIAAAPAELRRAALAMLIVAFATKAALVPLCFWMPATYPTPSAPLAALFAGIMTKLGVYALLRLVPLLAHDPLLSELLLWAGGLSALLGVLAALAQYELRRLLAFHSVSQVGYMVIGLALMTASGVAAAIFFALHHSLVKSALYFVADELERGNATRDLRQMDFRRLPGALLATCFGAAAFSLAGLPPFSGFFGKLSVFGASLEEGAWGALAMAVAASVFTLASMLKIWRFAFQRGPVEGSTEERGARPPSARAPRRSAIATMLALVLALGLGAGPAYRFSEAAAIELLGAYHAAEEPAAPHSQHLAMEVTR